MKKMKWATGILAALTALFAYSGGCWNAAMALETTLPAEKLRGISVTIGAMMAVAAAWTGAKTDRPDLAVTIGVSVVIVPLLIEMGVICLTADQAPPMMLEAMRSMLLILVLLLAIIWLVGGMIRRNLTERDKQ